MFQGLGDRSRSMLDLMKAGQPGQRTRYEALLRQPLEKHCFGNLPGADTKYGWLRSTGRFGKRF
ncbi:MAG: hypothetical protein ACKVIN_13900, partial [Longimicrobiales bacterium]